MIDAAESNAFRSFKKMMLHWGFGDTEATIYALLVLNQKPMTAKEISEKIGKAYSFVVNELNKLRRHGLIERNKEKRCYSYSAIVDIINLIRKERKKLINLLSEIKNSLNRGNLKRHRDIVEHLEKGIQYLSGIEEGKND